MSQTVLRSETAPKEFRTARDAWHWKGASLPQRLVTLDPKVLIQEGLRSLSMGPLIHADIGAGSGKTLDEISSLVTNNLRANLTSIGSEIFLYRDKKDLYHKADKRIVSPSVLNSQIKTGGASIVTVIAPDPIAPNFANQVLTGINLLDKNGILFFRSELLYEKGLGLLLSAGLSVADLGKDISKQMLSSQFIPSSRLQIAWVDNKPLETFLESHGCKIVKTCPGIERLKLLARSLSASGFHRRSFNIKDLEASIGLSAKEIRAAIRSWSEQNQEMYLRRFKCVGANKIEF